VNFIRPPAGLTRAKMIAAVTDGKPDTAMQSFKRVLSAREIAAVVDFIRASFMRGKGSGAYYHTPANGWPDMDRYADAFPFALGKLSLNVPEAQLTPEQRRGRRLYLSSCITCHGRGRPGDQPPEFKPAPRLSPGSDSHVPGTEGPGDFRNP
jgi:cytochrome c oxidase cbb3-type subunit 3